MVVVVEATVVVTEIGSLCCASIVGANVTGAVHSTLPSLLAAAQVALPTVYSELGAAVTVALDPAAGACTTSGALVDEFTAVVGSVAAETRRTVLCCRS